MKQESLLQRTVLILALFALIVAALYYSREFLAPIVFGMLLAMLFLPLVKWFQSKGIPHVPAILLCLFIFLLIIGGMIYILSWQVGNLEADTAKLERQIRAITENVQNFISRKIGVSVERQDKLINMQSEAVAPAAGSKVMGVVSFLTSFVVDFILVVVYIFLFLYFRAHLKMFILRISPNEERKKAESIIHNSASVSQQYLAGLAIMIACLWVMYGIGFSLIGVKYALFFAILCGLLEIVPFVGNLTGTTVTLLFSASQGASSTQLLLILGTYMLIQFIQTYLLEPLVVGSKVNINPLFTIIALVAAELVWGIPGMVLALPILGIIKIICDHIEFLQPYGMLIGERVEPRKRRRRSTLKK
ncbi:MAG: AI-2E family transporter [Chitinophagaceae bacterium]|nr:MAG: AI-2E family transporter [Chitinophagaceae bacterium]